MDKAAPSGWLGFLKNQPGVKPQELEHIGLEPWLAKQEGQVSKGAVSQYIESQQPQINEVRKGGSNKARNDLERAYESGSIGADEYLQKEAALPVRVPTSFASYQLRGGSNYGETLLTLPKEQFEKPIGAGPFLQVPYAGEYHSTHWPDNPNTLLHTRHNDRHVIANGEILPSLHLEEIQSDWHQAGRKQGYVSGDELPAGHTVKEYPYPGIWSVFRPSGAIVAQGSDRSTAIANARGLAGGNMGVPDAPFKTTWPDLALKRMLHRAATEMNPDGTPKYHALSWTAGKEQAERYPDPANEHGLHEFYNTNLVNKMNALTKKYGVRVGKGELPGSGNFEDAQFKGPVSLHHNDIFDLANKADSGEITRQLRDIAGQVSQGVPLARAVQNFGSHESARLLGGELHMTNKTGHIIKITPELRAAAAKGFPLFTVGGAVGLPTYKMMQTQPVEHDPF